MSKKKYILATRYTTTALNKENMSKKSDILHIILLLLH